MDDLQYLLTRLLFFYERGDEQRLITIGQYVLKNSQLVFAQVALQSVWQYRVNRLLLLSINQLFAPETSHAIPLRLLELFTKNHTQQSSRPASALETTFSFLVRNGFFLSMRKLLEEKTPPLDDGPNAVPPNPFCDALLQLLVRPLELTPNLVTATVRLDMSESNPRYSMTVFLKRPFYSLFPSVTPSSDPLSTCC